MRERIVNDHKVFNPNVIWNEVVPKFHHNFNTHNNHYSFQVKVETHNERECCWVLIEQFGVEHFERISKEKEEKFLRFSWLGILNISIFVRIIYKLSSNAMKYYGNKNFIKNEFAKCCLERKRLKVLQGKF